MASTSTVSLQGFMIVVALLATMILDSRAIASGTTDNTDDACNCLCDAWPFPTISNEECSRLEVYTHSSEVSSGRVPEDTVAYVELKSRYTTMVISGGTVRINGTTIEPQQAHGNTVYHARRSFPIRFNGAYNVFTVEGSKGFPALTDSVRSFMGRTIIAYPTPDDTVSRSRDLVILWNPELRSRPDNGAQVVHIRVRNEPGTVGSKSIQKRVMGDYGRCTVTKRELSALRPGPIRVTVARANEQRGRIDEQRTYEMVIGSAADVHATLAR